MKLFVALFFTLFTTLAFAQTPIGTATTATFGASQGIGAQAVSRNSSYSVVSVVTVGAPGTGAFTCAVTDICTKASHGMGTGTKTALTTSTTLPAGLSPGDYYVIKIDANTFYLASSSANALAGTHIDITDTGTGTHTSTPYALSGASLKLQCSMNGTNYADMPIKATGDATKSGTITTTANFYLDEKDLNCNYVRVYYTLAAGTLTVSQIPKVFKSVNTQY